MTERRTSLLIGLAMAFLPGLALLHLIQFGLPHWLVPDEAYILKDPFKLLVSYAHGDFTSPTNLFFWLIPLWYGLVFAGGLIGGAWHGASEFSQLIVGESPVFLYWGRVLCALSYVASIVVLYQVLAETVPKDRPLRLMAGLAIAANPIALCTVGFGKFDGMACLVTSGLVWVLTRYLTTDSLVWRRRLYVLAFVASAFRPDFVAVLAAIIGLDLVARRPIRPVLGAGAIGIGAYSLITLAPIVLIYKLVAGSRKVAMSVGDSFESVIINHYLKDFHGIGAFLAAVGDNAGYYGLLLAMLGPALLAAVWPGLPRDRMTRVFPVIAAVTLGPILLFPVHSPHYMLQALTYLWFAAIWSLSQVRRPAVRYGVIAASVVASVSLSVATFRTIRANIPDARVAAGQYLIAHSGEADTLALEEYENPGSCAVVPECPEVLTAKAEAIVACGMGSGQTFAAWAKVRNPACRRILSVSTKDLFENTPYAGRWALDYTKATLQPPLPLYLAVRSPLGVAKDHPGRPELDQLRQPFDQVAKPDYALEKAFATEIHDPRVAALLAITYYPGEIYVYRRIDGPPHHQP